MVHLFKHSFALSAFHLVEPQSSVHLLDIIRRKIIKFVLPNHNPRRLQHSRMKIFIFLKFSFSDEESVRIFLCYSGGNIALLFRRMTHGLEKVVNPIKVYQNPNVILIQPLKY
ncbi:uncharacterized protein LOC132315970 [Cornus florida]|uniref:uncharacterized protein LOC132315970 n=1 Tax=Cornus florida TaxID=4283 RepID=UPI00289ED729|nr:uncharacterized protein LOC132315970 [Cornus florida]